MQRDDVAQDCEDPGRAKLELRRRMLAARDQLDASHRAQLSALICERAADLPALVSARTLLVFASFRSEVDTTAFIVEAMERGQRVCLPRVLGPRRMAAYHVADVWADLVPGAWGIKEPRPDLEEVPPNVMDAVVVPGSAFDRCGRRSGYGGGFYDNYLPRTRPGTPWIALAFDLQLVDALVCEPHDLSVHAIVTESQVIWPPHPATSPSGRV
jgi:5-formyltetrahydrofolate cyclo-ligase